MCWVKCSIEFKFIRFFVVHACQLYYLLILFNLLFIIEIVHFAAHHETKGTPEDERVNPENPVNYEWIYYDYILDDKCTYGKWLVFKHFDELNVTWRKIIDAKRMGDLEGCTALKTSTKVYRPGSYGPGPCITGVIDVFTTKEQVESVGRSLSSLVRQDILYKTEKATLDRVYSSGADNKPVTQHKMFYNGGRPTLTFERGCMQTYRGYNPGREDIWHLNVVCSPHYPESVLHYGKWVLTITRKEATGVWHILKNKIESKKYGVLKMVCPKGDKESPFFHVYTTAEEWQEVGETLLDLLERDITYEFEEAQREIFKLKYE